MNTFTRQQYSLYAPRKKAKNKRTESNHKVKIKRKKVNKKRKKRQIDNSEKSATNRKLLSLIFLAIFSLYVHFFFALCSPFLRCFCFLLCFCFCFAFSFAFVLFLFLFFALFLQKKLFDGWSCMAAIAQHNSIVCEVRLLLFGWQDIYDSVVTLAQENEVANKAEWRAVLRPGLSGYFL